MDFLPTMPQTGSKVHFDSNSKIYIMQPDNKDQETKNSDQQKKDEGRHEYIPGVQEKSTIGGSFNTGVTSDDPAEKDEIEKQGALAHIKSKATDTEDSRDEHKE